jgi:hypothetical protein
MQSDKVSRSSLSGDARRGLNQHPIIINTVRTPPSSLRPRHSSNGRALRRILTPRRRRLCGPSGRRMAAGYRTTPGQCAYGSNDSAFEHCLHAMPAAENTRKYSLLLRTDFFAHEQEIT